MEATDNFDNNSDNNSYDLIVCGGGPAGAAAAISAAKADPQARILLLEAGSFPRHKVCGEFFSPEAAGVLQSLLGDNPSENSNTRLLDQSIRIDRVGLHVSSRSMSFALPRSAYSITRHDLDSTLWQRALQVGVRCLDRTRVLATSRVAERFTVATSGGDFAARCVINATGRWSEINNSTDGRTNLIGIKVHFGTKGPIASSCDLHFFHGGYIGIQPISQTAVNASALVDASKYRDMAAVLKAAGLGATSRDWKPLYAPITCPPVRFAAPNPTGDGILNCGDAAAFIDPFAGDGMSLALHSGVLAGGHAIQILSGAEPDEVTADYVREYRRRFANAFRSAACLRRFAFAPEWVQSLSIAALRVPYIAQAVLKSTRAA